MDSVEAREICRCGHAWYDHYVDDEDHDIEPCDMDTCPCEDFDELVLN